MQKKILWIGKTACFFVMALFIYATAEGAAHSAKAAPPANVWHVNVHDSVTKDNWTLIPPAIERLYTKNLDPDVNPDSYLSFDRDKSLTKGELAVMIVKLLNKQQEAQQYRQEIASLKDNSNVSPYFGWVETCLKYGYMNNELIPNWSMDKGFNPEGTVTRGEVLVTLIKLLNDIYPESLGQEGIIAPPELDGNKSSAVQRSLASLADLWPREKDGRFIHGILSEAIALNRKLTQIKTQTDKGKPCPYKELYPGFILTAKKYLLESSSDDRFLTQHIMNNSYGITQKGKINSRSVAKRYWACLLFSKCFAGEFVPTNRKVAASANQEDEQVAYGIFQDKWDLVGRIGSITKDNLENNTINVIKDNGTAVELKIFDHSYIYLLCPQKAKIEEKIGKIYAPDNDSYQDDKDIDRSRGYKRFYWMMPDNSDTTEVLLDNKNPYRPLIKIYRETTMAISPNEGYKEVDFPEKREAMFGFSNNPQRFSKDINYVDVDIEKACDLHCGLYHNERAEMTFVKEPCEYKTGKQFFNVSLQEANKLYQGKIIRAYFIPNRQIYDQLPIKNYAGFIEITPDEEWGTWHGIRSNRYPIICKSWFDLKGRCTMIDTKLSADVFRIDTDNFVYDADDMGEEASPILVPLGYKYFLSPAQKTQNKLEGFQFRKPEANNLLEQQFYIQLDEKGRVRFLESDVIEK
ncbi:hypothetical protein HY792_06415 [Candidatus Desantisbacteria bacterium]|nr:hypothetical protein [Candidatus Desantisbacteria bacterium]